jgi:hypothetical protein
VLAGRLLEKYALYEKVAIDLNEGEQDLGVWAAAFAEVKGDEDKARGKYIELMVQLYEDKLEAGVELAELLEEEKVKDVRLATLRTEEEQSKEKEYRKTQIREGYKTEKRPTPGMKVIREALSKNGYKLKEPLLGGWAVLTPNGERLKFTNYTELAVFYEVCVQS